MKVKTSELTGAALNWAVAKCEPDDTLAIYFDEDTGEPLCHDDWESNQEYKPSTDWAQGGAIIEREKLGVWWAHHVVDGEGNEYGNHWYAETGLTDENADERHVCMEGETPLIAAMRCYVASKLGDEVEIDDNLTGAHTPRQADKLTGGQHVQD